MTDLLDIKGRTILVTGASSGLGRHFAALLVRHGARVAAAARRVSRLDELATEVQEESGLLLPVELDVTSTGSIDAAINRVEENLGSIDAIVNNAGIAVQGKALEATEADFDAMFDTNVRGAFFLARRCAARMIERGSGGAIVNIASAAGLIPMPQLTAYGMSKAAVVHMTKSLAKEWARHRINVNAICPGYIATDINSEFFSSEAGHRMVERFPRKRIGEPADLDAALLMLLAPKASNYITGAVLSVDDGYILG